MGDSSCQSLKGEVCGPGQPTEGTLTTRPQRHRISAQRQPQWTAGTLIDTGIRRQVNMTRKNTGCRGHIRQICYAAMHNHKACMFTMSLRAVQLTLLPNCVFMPQGKTLLLAVTPSFSGPRIHYRFIYITETILSIYCLFEAQIHLDSHVFIY